MVVCFYCRLKARLQRQDSLQALLVVGLELFFESGDEVFVFGVWGEVVDFVGVVLVIVEFDSGFTGEPLDVAVALGSHGVAPGFGVVPDLGNGGFVPLGGTGVGEYWTEGSAFEVGGDLLELAVVGESWVEVEEFDGLFGVGGLRDSRSGHEEGHSGRAFESFAFVPESFFAEEVAVVRPENDEGLVHEVVLFQCIQKSADLSIDEGIAGVVGLFTFAGLLDGDVLEVVRPISAVSLDGHGRYVFEIFLSFFEVGDGDFVEWIEVEVAFGSNVRTMGVEEAGGEEEGLVFLFCNFVDDP